jgi:hypothetical protein
MVNSEPLTLTQRTAVPLSSELASLARTSGEFSLSQSKKFQPNLTSQEIYSLVV